MTVIPKEKRDELIKQCIKDQFNLDALVKYSQSGVTGYASSHGFFSPGHKPDSAKAPGQTQAPTFKKS